MSKPKPKFDIRAERQAAFDALAATFGPSTTDDARAIANAVLLAALILEPTLEAIAMPKPTKPQRQLKDKKVGGFAGKS